MITKAVLEGLSVKTGLEYAAEVKQADQIQHRVGKILLGLSKHTRGSDQRRASSKHDVN